MLPRLVTGATRAMAAPLQAEHAEHAVDESNETAKQISQTSHDHVLSVEGVGFMPL
ncbi:hypothetical protein [Streptomyces sp. NPDC050485]|uniref:hypothetical protein n=1 Tax=Streptomyces sp. NPDC050485 TaxID=3365617 RepID=UPI0037952B5B